MSSLGTRRARVVRSALLVSALAAVAPGLGAQVVRGTVRATGTLMPVDRATISARDSSGAVFSTTVTDPLGGYEFRVRADTPFQLHVRRVGYQISTASVTPIALGDTVDFEFLLTEVAAAAAAVVVTGESSLNDRRFDEATRRGWKVYEPELVMRHRERAQTFVQLLQSMGSPGLILPRDQLDCVRATRNNRCLTYVVDNQVLGPSASILPSDVYFFAVLSASDARIQFGDRAPFGAIVIYTRSRLDRVQPDPPPGRRNAGQRKP